MRVSTERESTSGPLTSHKEDKMIDRRCKVCVGKDNEGICQFFRDHDQCVIDHPDRKWTCKCQKVIKMKNAGYISKRFGPMCKKCAMEMRLMMDLVAKHPKLQNIGDKLLKAYDREKRKRDGK